MASTKNKSQNVLRYITQCTDWVLYTFICFDSYSFLAASVDEYILNGFSWKLWSVNLDKYMPTLPSILYFNDTFCTNLDLNDKPHLENGCGLYLKTMQCVINIIMSFYCNTCVYWYCDTSWQQRPRIFIYL